MPTTKQTRKGRLEVILPPEDLAELDRRAAEERLNRSAHVRRLVVADARANPADAVTTDLRAAA